MKGCKKVFKLSVDSWSVKQLQPSTSGVLLRSCTIGLEVNVLYLGRILYMYTVVNLDNYDLLLKTWLVTLKAAGQNCVHRRSISPVTGPYCNPCN